MANTNTYRILPVALMGALIFIWLIGGEAGAVDILSTTIGIYGLTMWFHNSYIGLVFIAVSLLASAISKDILASTSIIAIVVYTFVKIIQHNRKGEKAFSYKNEYVEYKWYIRLLVASIYVMVICNLYMNNIQYPLVGWIWIATPIFTLASMLMRDIRAFKMFISIELLAKGYIAYMLMETEGTYWGLIETIIIMSIVAISYMRAERIKNKT